MEGLHAFESVASTVTEPLLIIDMIDVPYMDSCALGALMNLYRPSDAHRRQLAIAGAGERVRTVFRIARVDDLLITFRSVEEAERKLGAKAAGT